MKRLLMFFAVFFLTVNLSYAVIPQTGQNKCYSMSSSGEIAVIPCENTGQDGDYKAGAARSFAHNSYNIVTDEVTGLEWEDTNHTGTFKGNQEDARNYCKNLNLDGKGWRLPTIEELLTIVDMGNEEGSFIFDSFTYQNGYTWSDTELTYVGLSMMFSQGITSSNGKAGLLNVRCVRGKKYSYPKMYRNNAANIVVDVSNNLMWQDNESINMAWEEAVNYCNKLDLAGFKDWRLPNAYELFFLFDRSKEDPAIDEDLFHNLAPYSGARYWSSTTFPLNTTSAYTVDLKFGKLNKIYKGSSGEYVRCVRGDSTISNESIALPKGFHKYPYQAPIKPIINNNPSAAKPFGAGDIKNGKLNLKIGLSSFKNPVDIYLAMSFDKLPNKLFLFDSDNKLHDMKYEIVAWKKNNKAKINESLFGEIPIAAIPNSFDGNYTFYVLVVPAGEANLKNGYLWISNFSIEH